MAALHFHSKILPSKSRVRLPPVTYDRFMTICIAAACLDNEKPAIVLCADKKKSVWEGVFSSDTASKVYTLAPGWCALLAGPAEFAKRLAWECGTFLKNNTVLHTTVQNQLQNPLAAFRRNLMNEEAAKWGVSYKDVFGGKIKDPDLLAEIKSALKAIPTDYSVILSGFVDGSPMIIKIENDLISSGDVFSIIGSGIFLAFCSD